MMNKVPEGNKNKHIFQNKRNRNLWVIMDTFMITVWKRNNYFEENIDLLIIHFIKLR